MGRRPRQDPNDIVDDTVDDEEESSETPDSLNNGNGSPDRFDTLLEKLVLAGTGGGAAPRPTGGGGGVDSNNMMMLFMMQQAKEAKEEKGQLLKLLVAALPALVGMFKGNGPDPLVLELVKSMTSGKQQEQMVQGMMALQQTQSESQMRLMQETITSTSRLKDDITKEALESMRANLDKANTPAASPAMEIFREIRLMAEPILAKKFGAETAPAATGTTVGPALTMAKTGAAGDAGVIAKERVPFILRALKSICENQATMTPAEKRSIRAKLAVVVADVPELCLAILEEKHDQIFEICKPYVLADAELFAWMGRDGTGDWINTYVTKQLAPVLDAMQEAEEVDAGILPDETPDAGDGDGTDDDAQPTARAANG